MEKQDMTTQIEPDFGQEDVTSSRPLLDRPVAPWKGHSTSTSRPIYASKAGFGTHASRCLPSATAMPHRFDSTMRHASAPSSSAILSAIAP
ncbi:hypothetical protein [Acetobacter vaccinii]|uniref:Uncharacterized protein n=1 Tax=Acetobacter vaccinii TaxID=2592655 RepID=A0A5C1YLH2_9PROT|nr:hypothetical protein [Acetobacter vaccinii]QEO16823.1 hypothetical protein FLP30_02840 [Acetobacter vaccinii]